MLFSKWTSSIIQKGSQIIQSGVDSLSQLGNNVNTIVDESASAIKGGIEDVRSQSESFLQEAKDILTGEGSLQERFEDLAKAGENALASAGERLEQTGEALKQAGEGFVSNGKDVVENTVEDIKIAGLEALEDGRNILSDGAAMLKEGATRIENDANAWLGGVYDAVRESIRVVDEDVNIPSVHVAFKDETDAAQGASLISLTYLDEKNLASMAWNSALTQRAIDALGLAASGKAGGLLSVTDASCRVLEILDADGGLVLTLTLLAPGEGENVDGENWAVRYEQSGGLAHPLGGLAHNDALLLPLFADSISDAGLHVPNAIGIAITDDGPKPQFSSNFLILDALGNDLLSDVNDITGGSVGDLLHRAVFDENGKVDLDLDKMVEDIRNAGSNALSGALSLDNEEAIKDLVSVLIDRDLGQGIKDFIQNNILMILVPQATKDSLCDTVDSWLNYNDTRRPVEGTEDAQGSLNVDFGLDGPATEHTRPLGWELLHGDAEPAPVGWSVAGVQAMFDLMQIRASLYQDTRLVLSVASDDNSYPPQKLVAMAGDVEVMTLEVDSSVPGQYGYVIHQNTGLCHDQNSLLNTLLGLVESTGDYDAQLASLVDMIMEGLESALGSFSGLVLGALDTDLKALLQETLTVEHIVKTFSTDNLLYLPLPYITMDGDGDVSANLAFHAIKDSVPLVEGRPAVLVVAEADLDVAPYVGSDAAHMADNAGRGGTDESLAEGSLVVQAFDGIGPVMIGETLVWDGSGSHGAVAGKYGSLEVTGVDDLGGGRYQINYLYSLERAALHEAPALDADLNRKLAGEDAEESFIFTITDGDGDFVNASVVVEIVDDIPHPINVVDDGPLARIVFETQPEVTGIGAEGVIPLNYGADGPSGGGDKPAFQIGLRPVGNGEIEYQSVAEDGRIVIEGKYGDLYVDPESGEYHYVLDQEKVESAEPGGHYETQLVTKAYDLSDSAVTPQNLTGILYDSIEAFKGKNYSDAMVQNDLASGTFASWRNSSKATVSNTSQGFGVAGRAGGILTSDGDKIGFGLSGFALIHEAVLVHLVAASSSLDLTFGDMGGTDLGKVFLYGEGGSYLGTRYFGSGNANHDSVTIYDGDFDVPVKSFLVVPQTGNFTLESISVPEAQEVWVPNSGDDLRLTEDFSYILTDADGDSAGGNLKLDLGNPDDMDFQMGDRIFGDESDALIVGSGYNDTIVGGSGNEMILAGGGSNEIWGGEGADTFAWNQASLAPGKDKIMDFSTQEGDRISFSQLLDHGDSLDRFLVDHIANATVAKHDEIMSFTIEGPGTVRQVAIHFTDRQTPDFGNMVLQYVEAGFQEQEEIAMQIIKSICE